MVATANNIRKLPESLTRAGRFDHVLELNCPEGKDAQAIVAHYLSQKPYPKKLNFEQKAYTTFKSEAQARKAANS